VVATAALAWSEQIRVGLALMPTPLRNVALTAMEIATLDRLFPGRFQPTVGHGVQFWMAQVGARAASPLTLLREYTVALRRLLDGERVSVTGEYVTLDDVALGWPPLTRPRLLLGGAGPKTLRLAGELGDGTMLTGQLWCGVARGAGQAAAGATVGAGGQVISASGIVRCRPTIEPGGSKRCRCRPRATSRATSIAPWAWKWVLSWTPSG
jgi:alkanesulfonate monooxygenase SsuD/methylene tetrahydromethanopterin reductase-like flavin-dependent oxidoreductase (luciferase family)